MENLIKQTRVRYSDAGGGNREDLGNLREGRIPPQKTQSFKGGATSSTSSDESEKMAEEKLSKKAIHPAPSINNAGTFSDKNSNMSKDVKDPRKVVAPSPPVVQAPTNTAKKTSGQLPHTPVGPAPSNAKTRAHADKKPTTQPAFSPTRTKMHDPRKPIVRDIDADAWERAEMAKIKERSQKLRSTIDSWEEKKKKKAKDRKEKTERKLEQKRAAALTLYQEELQSIVAIAGGARAQADEKRRNKELKVKEKANRIRTTGTYPTTCLCF